MGKSLTEAEKEMVPPITDAAENLMRVILRHFPDSRETVEKSGAILTVEVTGHPDHTLIVAFPPLGRRQ
jgi:hypothetical protein